MRPSHVLTLIAAISGLSSAWPWPPSSDDLKAPSRLDDFLFRRQDGGSGNINGGDSSGDSGNSGDSAAAKSAAASASAAARSGSTITAKPTLKGTGSVTSGGKSGGSTASTHATTSVASIPTNAFPGGVHFVSPNSISNTAPIYAISSGVSSTVTWVWNYTSLIRPPAAIDVVATMAASAGGLNPSPFTISTNLSFSPTETFKWDTGSYAETSGMPDGMYTLLVYDADAAGGATAIPSPGKLAPFAQFSFGVYQPQQYIEVSPSFICTTCNAAGGKMERLTWGVLTGMVGISMATIIWFTGLHGLS